jgi:hypothetical protein
MHSLDSRPWGGTSSAGRAPGFESGGVSVNWANATDEWAGAGACTRGERDESNESGKSPAGHLGPCAIPWYACPLSFFCPIINLHSIINGSGGLNLNYHRSII